MGERPHAGGRTDLEGGARDRAGEHLRTPDVGAPVPDHEKSAPGRTALQGARD